MTEHQSVPEHNGNAYNDLIGMISHYKPNFFVDQIRGSRLIAGIGNRLDLDAGEKNSISSVIAVGCGTGEILIQLSARMNRLKFCLGIDVSRGSIEYATQCRDEILQFHERDGLDYLKGKYNFSDEEISRIIGGKVEIEFINGDFCEFNFDPYKDKIDPARTLIICVGHTAPHMPLLGFVNKVTELDVPFLLLDWHRSWDSIVESIKDGKNGCFEPEILDVQGAADESASPAGKPSVLGLRTCAPDTKGVAERGIAKFVPETGTFEWLSSPVRQYLIPSGDTLEKLKASGYFVVHEEEYTLGYGVKCSVLLHKQTSIEKVFNSSHYEVLRKKLLADIFNGRGGEAISRRLSFYLNMFDGVIFAAMLPYGGFYSFAKYLPVLKVEDKIVFDVNVDDDSNQYEQSMFSDLLMQPYSRAQCEFVTADGLYHCMLANPGGALVLGPSDVKGAEYNVLENDIEYRKEEDRYLDCVGKNLGLVESIDSNDLHHFLVIPVFFGSFPLIALACRMRRDGVFDQGFCQAIGTQVSRVVSEQITSDLIKTHYVEPLLERVMSRTDKFSMVRKLEKGDMLSVVENALNKPWKSWLEYFPDLPITVREDVSMQNRKFKGVFGEGYDRLCRDRRWVISKLLQDIDFFVGDDAESSSGGAEADAKVKEAQSTSDGSKGPHEQFHTAHLQRLAGVLESPGREYLNFSTLVNLLVSEQWIEGSDSCAYSKFLFSKLTEGDKGFQCPEAKDAFSDIKSVFCRTHENTGPDFRFSLKGFKCLVGIELGNKAPKVILGSEIAKPFVITGSPEVLVLEFIKNWCSYKDLPAITEIRVNIRKPVDGLVALYSLENVGGERYEYIVSFDLCSEGKIFIKPDDCQKDAGRDAGVVKNLFDRLRAQGVIHVTTVEDKSPPDKESQTHTVGICFLLKVSKVREDKKKLPRSKFWDVRAVSIKET